MVNVSAHRTACPLDCPDGCSLAVEVADGRLTRVDAAPVDADDEVNPLTLGFICQKVKHHASRVYAPERVMTPLVRSGPKGDGSFQSATWDEALDLVAERFEDVARRDGPEAVVPYLYNSSAGVLGRKGLAPLLWRAFGASEVAHTICAATAGAAWELTLGDLPGADLLDVVHSRLVLVWGANPSISNTHLTPLLARARRDNGAAVVVVDPRATATARRADLHLPVRPGTDVVLAMALARRVEELGGVDSAFTDAHAAGADEYQAACGEWSVARAADVCGVDTEAIEQFARLLADPARRPTFVRLGYGMERNRNGGSAHRAVLALAVLIGAFGTMGSGAHLHTDHSIGWDGDGFARAVLGDPTDPGSLWRPRGRVLNQNHLGSDLLDPRLAPPISALFVQGANVAVMNPAQTKVVAGLTRDDLFTVVHDQVLTDTARLADVVLPATTHFEVTDVSKPYGAFVGELMRPVIDRVGESRTNDEVAAGLAKRFGFPSERFDPDPERLLAIGLAASGGRPASDRGRVQFRDVFPSTPDGRARLVGDGAGVDRVPTYRSLDSPFPLVLVSPASRHMTNSIFGEAGRASPAIHLHPDDASARGIVDGDRVRIDGPRARVETVARVDPDLRPGVAAMAKGLWLRATASDLSANAFAPDDLADLAGGATFNDARVEVARIAGAPAN